MQPEHGFIKTEVLVVGSGLAGLLAAIEAAKTCRDVTIIDKGLIGKSGCTIGAQNIAAGGAGHLYPITTNFDQAIGDGLALALKAGCVLRIWKWSSFIQQ